MEAVAAHRLAAVAVAALALVAAPLARADGDPASDVLISQGAFFPYYIKIPPASQAALTKTVADAKKRGYTVRVALLAHTYDMGTAGVLWHRPQPYSKFLAQELANFNTGWVLTVMPNGYGIYHCVGKKRSGGYTDPCESAKPSGPDRRLLASLPKPGAGPGIVPAADTAVRRLAALHGVNVASRGGGFPLVPVAAGVGVLLLAAAGGVALWRRRATAG